MRETVHPSVMHLRKAGRSTHPPTNEAFTISRTPLRRKMHGCEEASIAWVHAFEVTSSKLLVSIDHAPLLRICTNAPHGKRPGGTHHDSIEIGHAASPRRPVGVDHQHLGPRRVQLGILYFGPRRARERVSSGRSTLPRWHQARKTIDSCPHPGVK